MKRQKRSSYQAPSYPTADTALSRRGFLKSLGAVAGASVAVAATAACPPFFPPMMGEMPYPDELQTVYLPAVEESHQLQLGLRGSISYRIEVMVQGFSIASSLEENRDALLQQVDALLVRKEMVELAPENDMTAIQAELTQLLADAYYGVEDSPTHVFYSVFFIVDDFQERRVEPKMAKVLPGALGA